MPFTTPVTLTPKTHDQSLRVVCQTLELGAPDTRVVAQKVARPEALVDGVRQSPHRRRTGHIGRVDQHIGLAGELLLHVLEGGGVDVGDCDAHALGQEAPHQGEADPVGSARHHGDFVPQIFHRVPSVVQGAQPLPPAHGSRSPVVL